MGLFLGMQTCTPSQKKKIINAVTPLLSKTNPLDSKIATQVRQKYARAVVKKLE